MSTRKEFMVYVADQMSDAAEIRYRSMFGEYGVYANDKFFALVCDDKLFIKPTNSGRDFIKSPVEAPPYPGAKNYFLIEDKLDDRQYMAELIVRTISELPEPKPKKPRKTRKKAK
jgi:TfoX/Sxy family transcriptional regulator of competence genes